MHLHFHDTFHLHVLPLPHITPSRHSHFLHEAARNGRLDVVRLFLDEGADANAQGW
jgi:hypothetical protein